MRISQFYRGHAWPVAALALSFGAPDLAIADASQAKPMIEITIQGGTEARPPAYSTPKEQAPVTTPDTAALLRRAPGGGVNSNGPLTGIAQYRGMYGDRVNVLIDGTHISSGGPNGMDPPLSYIPRAQLESLQIIRGIAPVSSGLESIGGTVLATSRRSHFAADDAVSPGGEINAGGASVDSSTELSALGSVANRDHRLHLYGSRENGGNYRFPDGKVKASRFERVNFGGGYGFRSAGQTFSIDLRRNETDPTGTPALPMDIVYINTSMVQGEYRGEVNGVPVHARLDWSDVDHWMSNYELRDPPMPMMTRLNDAHADGAGYRFDASVDLGPGRLLLGVDGHLADHDSTVIDPINNPMFRVQNFNDVERNVYGLFGEWNGSLARAWSLELGVRYNRIAMDAGKVSASLSSMNPDVADLQNRFNSTDRSKADDNLDLVARLVHGLSSRLALSLEAGRKTRSPSYQERYLWLPIEATNGLADGNTYVGDVDLDPEKAYEVGAGLDWRGSRFHTEPRVFYRYVDDYIQGVPAADPEVIDVDPTAFAFSNVDARLYGADAPWGVALGEHWSLDGVISYVRGKRADISDNLYRIAPLNGRVTLGYRRTRWWASVEGVFYADQDEVSETNNEQKSDAYSLVNLNAGLELGPQLTLAAGVENLTDKQYEDHLSGINRVSGSDVALGERLPGRGRSYFASLELSFD
ncbi:MAG: TonB-dependent receptor [Gammaproteobacteria bacterium]|jgi:iron complex outermembrane receptor protein